MHCLLAGCGNLPYVEGGKPPTTLVQVKSYAKSSARNSLTTLYKSEVIEVIMCTLVDILIDYGSVLPQQGLFRKALPIIESCLFACLFIELLRGCSMLLVL